MRQRDRERISRVFGVSMSKISERVVPTPNMRTLRSGELVTIYFRQTVIDRTDEPGRGIEVVATRPLVRLTREHLLLM